MLTTLSRLTFARFFFFNPLPLILKEKGEWKVLLSVHKFMILTINWKSFSLSEDIVFRNSFHFKESQTIFKIAVTCES